MSKTVVMRSSSHRSFRPITGHRYHTSVVKQKNSPRSLEFFFRFSAQLANEPARVEVISGRHSVAHHEVEVGAALPRREAENLCGKGCN